MVITELVANAVDHARTESTLSIGVAPQGLCVAVRDTHTQGPVPRTAPINRRRPAVGACRWVDALATSVGGHPARRGQDRLAVLGPDRA